MTHTRNVKKIVTTILIVTFFFGYLEWGKDNHQFIFQAAEAVFRQGANDVLSIIHPFIIIPLLGIVVLIWTMFQARPNRSLTLIGTLSLACFILFLFVIGLLTRNLKIIASTIPFLTVASVVLWGLRKKRPVTGTR